MQYINPVEILQLSNVADSSQIDSDTIKKSKRRLFADIDLSYDRYFNYYGLQLTKGNCERAINELSNNDLKEFYLYLTSNKKLNEFLVSGNENVFYNFNQDSIFKLPEFINFISPYFASKFDKALLGAFEDEDVDLLQSILKTSFLISQNNVNTAYKSVSHILQDRFTELSEIRNDIKNEESGYYDADIHEVVDLVENYFPTELLNSLPNYFQSQILKIANEINYLNVAIWDNFDNPQVCQNLLGHILKLNIDGLYKPTFQKNYEIVKRKNQERIEQERNAPILKKYAKFLIEAKSKIEEIKNKILAPNSLVNWMNASITIYDINLLPRTFDEIKNQVAFSLRAMSVSIWNSYSNMDVSLFLIEKALSITGLKSETLQNLSDAKTQLTALKNNSDSLVSQTVVSPPRQPRITRATRPTTNPISNNNTNWGWLWIFGVIAVFTVIVLLTSKFNSNKSSSDNYNSKPTYKNEEPTTKYDNHLNKGLLDLLDEARAAGASEDHLQEIVDTYERKHHISNDSSGYQIFQNATSKKLWQLLKDEGGYTKSYDEFMAHYSNEISAYSLYGVLFSEGRYTKSFDDFKDQFFLEPKGIPAPDFVIEMFEGKGNQLEDGASPFDGCFGKGVYGGNATLTIQNGGSSDAIVCLYSVGNGRTIRNEYVRKNSSFTMSNISQGSYKIRVFYGNYWNPTLTNSCGTKGNFESDIHFAEFDGTEYFEDSERGYTAATITLYTVAGGNASSSSIDQSTFFNN